MWVSDSKVLPVTCRDLSCPETTRGGFCSVFESDDLFRKFSRISHCGLPMTGVDKGERLRTRGSTTTTCRYGAGRGSVQGDPSPAPSRAMQTRSSTSANSKSSDAQNSENAASEQKVGESPAQTSNSTTFDDRTQQGQQQQNTEPWTSSSESLVQPYVQNSASGHSMVRPAQVSSSSMMLNMPAHRVHCQLPHIPALGERRFSVSITPQTKSSKNLDYVVNKCKGGMTLYSKSDLMVPFVFSFTENLDPSTRIRVRAEYTEERYANKAVERCPNHQFKDKGVANREHFVRCEHPRAEYVVNDGVCSILIPMCDSTGISFTCFSSCSGGINRRPLQLLFLLESPDGALLGTSYVSLKVCANPLRDSSKEDDKIFDPAYDALYNGMAARKRYARPVEGDYKRTRIVRSFAEESNNMYEIHMNDARKFRKLVWLIMNEEKIEQLLSLDVEENPFRDTFMPNEDTLIKNWLVRQDIGLGALVDEFERRQLYTLGDLAKVYRGDLFVRFGLDHEHCSVLNKAFQDWIVLHRAITTGQMDLEALSGYQHV